MSLHRACNKTHLSRQSNLSLQLKSICVCENRCEWSCVRRSDPTSLMIGGGGWIHVSVWWGGATSVPFNLSKWDSPGARGRRWIQLVSICALELLHFAQLSRAFSSEKRFTFCSHSNCASLVCWIRSFDCSVAFWSLARIWLANLCHARAR